MKQNSRGRPRKTDGKRLDKPVYLSEELYTELVIAACAEGFTDWRKWVEQILMRRRHLAFSDSLLATLPREDNNVTT